MNNRPIIRVDFTVGFGNNLFQFAYAKLLAEKIGGKIFILPPSADYFGMESLELILNSVDSYEIVSHYEANNIFNKDYSTIQLSSEEEAISHLKNPKVANYELRGYFEDFTLYKNELNKIRSWFFRPEKRPSNEAVLHLRLGDRLFIPTTYDSKAFLNFDKYSKALDNLNFDTLHIVSDLPEWKNYSGDELLQLEYHTHLNQGAEQIKDKAADYVNNLVSQFSERYNIEFHHKGLARDFEFIRNFDKIIFGYSTFAWWAAVLSEASQIGVFEPWRPWKSNNKNLGKTNYPGWFGWK
jgi:hypothetical protein